MTESNADLAITKVVVGLIAGSGTAKIVKHAIRSYTVPNELNNKFSVRIATFVLSSIAGGYAMGATVDMIDTTANVVRSSLNGDRVTESSDK